MNLSDLEVKAAFHIADEFVRRRRARNLGIPDAVRRLYARLDYAVRWGADPNDTPPATDGDIGTAEAARILGCTERYVRMIAADLDGIRVGRTWVFNRSTVTEYAQARTAA